MPRSTWKGFLRLSLVSVPVRAYTVSAAGGGVISLNQLHASCNSRIRYRKTCPIHGEVSNDEIVSGYQYAKDQYVVVDPDELDKLRSESDRSINIDAFIHPEAVDPIFFSGSAQYLAPDGPVGHKPYALLYRAMVEENLYCIAQVVMSGKEQLVLIRPLENLLCMMTLEYASRIRQPDEFASEVGGASFSAKELDLTRSLVQATVEEDFDVGRYQDLYTERMRQLVEAKIEGRDVVAPPAEEKQEVINLMDALRASIQRAKGREGAAAKTRPKTVGGQRPRKSTKRRKTG